MHHAQRPRWTLLAALAASFVVLALGFGAHGTQAQDGAAVSIVDFAFQPASVEVPAGSTVTWTNAGAAPHTVTADDGAFDSGELAPGATFSQTFDARGTIAYHCEIHPQMTGTVTVTGGGGGGGGQAATTETAQVPRTGTGTVAGGRDATLMVLAAAMALLLGTGAHLARRQG